MLAVYIALMVCTMTPVIAMQAGADASVLVWLAFCADTRESRAAGRSFHGNATRTLGLETSFARLGRSHCRCLGSNPRNPLTSLPRPRLPPKLTNSAKTSRKVRRLIADRLGQRNHSPKYKRSVQNDGPDNSTDPEVTGVAEYQPEHSHAAPYKRRSQ